MEFKQQIYSLIEAYILPSKESEQLYNLKRILYINPLLIYKDEEQWKENKGKLKLLCTYNQTETMVFSTFGYMALIHLISLFNFRVSRQYSLRRAWAQNICRKSFIFPGISYYLYANVYNNQYELFQQEIQKMQSLPKGEEFLYSKQYVKDKYFMKINKKLSDLLEDSYFFENQTKKTNEDIIAESGTINKKQKNISKQSTNKLKSDDYYFEINEIIEELDEDNFFD